jgi:hypothetical protein
MKSLIVCVSKSHGNSRRVADRMAEALGALRQSGLLDTPSTRHHRLA